MSLVIRNLQRAVPLRRAPLRGRLQVVRRILGVQAFDLGLVCMDNGQMRRVNRVYRGKDVPTDVLSFPFHENLKPGEVPQPHSRDDYNLGDIFLGVEYILHQCNRSEDYCYYDTLAVTATHGLCHLLGFTHGTEAEWQQGLLRGLGSCIAAVEKVPAVFLIGLKAFQLARGLLEMYQKEEQVLEDLGRHLGTQLQPLSRGLF